MENVPAVSTPPARVPRLVEYDPTWRVYWVLKDGPASLDGIEKRLETLHDRLHYHHIHDQATCILVSIKEVAGCVCLFH